jgi:hypothetical protein
MKRRKQQPQFDYSVVCSMSGLSNVRADMACVTEKSLVATSPVLRLELPYSAGARICVRPRDIGTVYHCTAAQRNAERAFNRALARETQAPLLVG